MLKEYLTYNLISLEGFSIFPLLNNMTFYLGCLNFGSSLYIHCI